MIDSQWKGKKVAFFGDSITDPSHVGTEKNYWQFLQERIGIEPFVYGLSGRQWGNIPEQTSRLISEHGHDVDAILIFIGTNDFIDSLPPGEWFRIHPEMVNAHGKMVRWPRRRICLDPGTVRGRINVALSQLKENFPLQQIILLTPIHRAYACFSDTNVQPDETFPNALGLYFDEYIRIIREAADLWSCPLIDLYRSSGLHPLTESHGQFFHLSGTDRLHPNASGHERIASTMLYQMLTLPATFR